MFNREVIEQLKVTNDLLQTLIKRGGEEKVERVNAKDPTVKVKFLDKARNRPGWGTLCESATELIPRNDVGKAIAIPTLRWSKVRLVWDTVHLLGYVCPKAMKGDYVVTDEVDVVVIDRMGKPQRYPLEDFVREYPYFYRMSNV